LEAGAELWVKLIDDEARAMIYNEDSDGDIRYISLVDIIATMKPDEIEELPTRSLELISTLDGLELVYYGTEATLTGMLTNFNEDDKFEVKWQYSKDGEEFIDIDGAHELEYKYVVTEENLNNIWKITITLLSDKQE